MGEYTGFLRIEVVGCHETAVRERGLGRHTAAASTRTEKHVNGVVGIVGDY
jgi:hypothetical protein